MNPLHDHRAREWHTPPSSLPHFTIALGRPGAAFRVTLRATPLAELLDAVRAARRLYELLLITRPGDVLSLVWVRIEEAPPWLMNRLLRGSSELPKSWQEGQIPFAEFNRCFSLFDEDLHDGEYEWIELCNSSPELRAYIGDLFARVRSAAGTVALDDDALIAQVVKAVQEHTHPYCFLERQDALSKGRQYPTNMPVHPPGFYRKLTELLSDPLVTAVAYRAAGDYSILRLLATEQARRRSGGGCLRVSALVERRVDPDAWAAQIDFYDEGIGPSDLFIDGGGLGRSRLAPMMSVPKYAAKRFILATVDHGPLDGYARDVGEDHCLYTRD